MKQKYIIVSNWGMLYKLTSKQWREFINLKLAVDDATPESVGATCFAILNATITTWTHENWLDELSSIVKNND